MAEGHVTLCKTDLKLFAILASVTAIPARNRRFPSFLTSTALFLRSRTPDSLRLSTHDHKLHDGSSSQAYVSVSFLSAPLASEPERL